MTSITDYEKIKFIAEQLTQEELNAQKKATVDMLASLKLIKEPDFHQKRQISDLDSKLMFFIRVQHELDLKEQEKRSNARTTKFEELLKLETTSISNMSKIDLDKLKIETDKQLAISYLSIDSNEEQKYLNDKLVLIAQRLLLLEPEKPKLISILGR